jgi:AAA15 family ATPase/GTPase
MNKIKYLSIANFRHLVNLDNIKIGEKLTIIAGVNGTGKSSLLGLIGHVFSFRDDKGVIIRAIDNKRFETQFSEVFRFSPKYDYHSIPYSYSLIFENGTVKEAISRYVEADKRFRIDVGERAKASGKMNLPVIYLGLKRLIPLAQENDTFIKTIQDNKLDEEERELYQEWHNKVLVIADKVIPQHTKSLNKELYYAVCDKYDAFGNSAGQDNLAQIILALLSFRRLKGELKERYPGGLLLIDEIDTTLYPAAQVQLMKLLLKCAGDYDIQIVFTTHSTEIIGYMLNPKDNTFYFSSEIIYLHKPKGTIEVIQDKKQIDGILADLKHSVQPKLKKEKINTYLEDEEARVFLKGIIRSEISKNLKISKFNSGANFYESLLKEKFSEFKKSIIVLDGDKSKDKEIKKHKNVLCLPGLVSPEHVFCSYLDELSNEDEFWSSQLGGYNKQTFLMNKPNNTSDRVRMKEWFNKEIQNWGKGGKKLINRWTKDNQKVVDEFCDQLTKKIEQFKS